jgi:uncharacterized cupredoxin-like copper-binding protein
MVGRNGKAWALVGAALALALVTTACSSDEDDGAGGTSGGGGGTTVAVTLQEFAIAAVPASVPAGSVTFETTNTGPEDIHEFVVIKTDLAPDALPTVADGSVDEEGEGIEPVDEIEDIEVGATPSLTVDLAAGNYVLICNIYTESEQESHYQEGMRTAFMVE